jgi:hypothetical protein
MRRRSAGGDVIDERSPPRASTRCRLAALLLAIHNAANRDRGGVSGAPKIVATAAERAFPPRARIRGSTDTLVWSQTLRARESPPVPEQLPLSLSLTLFAFVGVLILFFGVRITHVAAGLARRTRLGEAVMGALFLGPCTSLPEIATATTAAASGHADLAMSNAIGSVAGQTAFLAFADTAYRDGSIFAAASPEQGFLLALAAVLTSVLLMGLVYRERHGIANIGLESFLVLAFYLGGFGILITVA